MSNPPPKITARKMAVDYARLFGWHVLPVFGKKPTAGDDWPSKASNDPSQVDVLFSRTRHDGIGLLLGVKSGIVDVEIDSPEGEETLRLVFGGNIPQTPTYSSTRGNHRLFKYSAAIPDSHKAKYEFGGLEIRIGGEAAQSVIPISGGRKWIINPTDCDLAEIPPDALDRLRERLEQIENDKKTRGSRGSVSKPSTAVPADNEKLNVELYLARNNVQVIARDVGQDGASRWFIACPRNASHTNTNGVKDCVITQEHGGRLGGHCVHVSCGMGSWQDIKGAIGPLHRDDFPQRSRPKHSAPPAGEPPKVEPKEPVRNFYWESRINKNGESELKQIPLSMSGIIGTTMLATDNWPRRVGEALFYHDHADDAVTWLTSAPATFGLIGYVTGKPPQFKEGDSFHTKSECFAELKRTATSYTSVEYLPHVPQMTGSYYACSTPNPGDGRCLDEFIGRFNPSSDIDADLLKAAIVTPFAGLRGGSRPVFCITSLDGRGSGKTTFAVCTARLAGYIEVSSNESFDVVKQRLISPDALAKRVLFIDNLKSHRFSSAELESFVTAPIISGKKLYVGECQRPNTLTVFMTQNGIALATDMAQRTVVIMLSKPTFSATWREETERFIDDRRGELIADIVGFLSSPQTGDLSEYSRWGDWQRQVLCRLPEPSETAAVIRDRQAVSDVENEESCLIEETFSANLASLGYDPSRERVFIPSSVAADWYCEATRTREGITTISRILNQKIDENQINRLKSHRQNDGRGFAWSGPLATSQTEVERDLLRRIVLRKQAGTNL